MKVKRSLKQSTTPKMQQKLTLYFVAAGVALAVLVGIGIFIYLNVGTPDDTKAATKAGQGYTSHDNYSGIWDDPASWTKDQSWMNDVPSYTGNYADHIDINGYITRQGDLTIGGGTTLTINDTLWVNGNFYFNDKYLTINPGGVLIVAGDFLATGGTLSSNNGRVVVLGDLTASGGATINNNNDFYVFNSRSASGGTSFNGSPNNPANSNLGDEDDLQANDPGLFSFVNGGGSSGALPVTLSYFMANWQGQEVLTEWATEAEVNHAYFTVERSTDGKNFQALTIIQGEKDSKSAKTYHYFDTDPMIGIAYYRLKQTNDDDTYDYSSIVSVTNTTAQITKQQRITILSVSPNPFDQTFSVEFDMEHEGKVEVRIMDINGNVVSSEHVAGLAGNNRYDFSSRQKIQPGIYLLHIRQGQTTSKVTRLIKK